MTIQERIRLRRKALHLTAGRVAKALGVSRATVYRYESAEIEKIPLTVLEPLAKVLKTSPSYLLGWTEYPPEGNPDISTQERPLHSNYTKEELNILSNYCALDILGQNAVRYVIAQEQRRMQAQKEECLVQKK